MATLNLRLDPRQMETGSDRAENALKGVKREAKQTESAVDRMSGSLRGAGHGLRGASNRLSATTSAFRNMRGQIQNTAFQLGDFATQVGAGTSASVALGQQLPQLLGGFGALGAVMGAVVAIGVPLAANFLSLGGNADELSDAIDGIKENTANLREELALLQSGLDNVEQLRIQQKLNKLIAERARLQNDIDNQRAPEAVLRTMEGQVAALDDQIAAQEKLLADNKELIRDLESAQFAAQDLSDTLFGIDMSHIISQADILVNRFTSATAAIGQMLSAAGQAGKRAISEDQKIRLQDYEIQQRQSGASATSIAGGVAAMKERFRLEGQGIPPAMVETLVNDAQQRGEQLAANKATIAGFNKSSRGGGGRGGISEIERTADAYDRLIASMDPFERAAQDLAQSQELINDAQAAGIITAEEAARAYGMAEDEYEKMIDRAKGTTNELEDITNATSGAFDQLFDGIVSGGTDAADVLDNLAAQLIKLGLQSALTNAFPGIFGDGGWLSFDGGGRTPSGPRSGGVDGKGGFPAILHPNETVIDHTKPANRNASGGMNVEFRVINNTDSSVTQRKERGPDGREVLIAEINNAVANGKVDPSFNSRFGIKNQRVKR